MKLTSKMRNEDAKIVEFCDPEMWEGNFGDKVILGPKSTSEIVALGKAFSEGSHETNQ